MKRETGDRDSKTEHSVIEFNTIHQNDPNHSCVMDLIGFEYITKRCKINSSMSWISKANEIKFMKYLKNAFVVVLLNSCKT